MEKKLKPVYEKIYINGEWLSPVKPEFTNLIHPATGEISGQVVRGNEEDVDRAVKAARAAFPEYSKTTIEERKKYLKAFAAECEKRLVEIEEAITLDIGAPKSIIKLVHTEIGLPVWQGAIDALEQIKFQEQKGSTLIVREPIGVAALISPWNNPTTMFCTKVASALAAGCTIVFKPAELATHTAMVLADILISVDLPKGVFNMVLGKGSVVGEAMSTHPEVDFISFTGSNPVGKRIAENAAIGSRRVGLELGGKSAFIVMPDSDIMQTAQFAVSAIMLNSGQVCSAGSRTLVPREMKDEFVSAMKFVLENMKVGNPYEPDTYIGPVVSEHQWDTIQKYIQAGMDEGAKLIIGGTGKPEGLEKGSFVRPTIFADVTNDMTIAQEEIFGPVACVIAYDSIEEAISIANDSPYGLAGYVFGPDHEKATDVAKQLRTGAIMVNSFALDVTSPWGGYKASGLGREFGEFGIEEMLELKGISNYVPTQN